MSGDYSVDSVKVITEKKETELIANSVLQTKRLAGEASSRLQTAGLQQKNYGNHKFPYGFKLHYLMENSEAHDENTWYLKAECTVTNMFGAEADGTVEAVVTGTKIHRKSLHFNVY